MTVRPRWNAAAMGRTSIAGRADIARYWAKRLEAAVPDAFRLINILPGDEPHNAVLDYTSYEGRLVRIYFDFAPTGKIAATACGPLDRSSKQHKGTHWSSAY